MATVKYKRDFKALESRRRKGMRMLARGVVQAEVARASAVSRQWRRMGAQRLAGARAWRLSRWAGPRHSMHTAERQLAERLRRGAIAGGFPTELWTLQRIGALIERDFGVRFSSANVWLLLRAWVFPASGRWAAPSSATRRPSFTSKMRRRPALKKSAAAKAARSSSSTSRD